MRLNVLLVSNQIRGVDGTGGLGDVAVGLCKALLSRQDIDIRLAMPGYAEITEEAALKKRFDTKPIVTALMVPSGSGVEQVDVFRISLPNSQPPITTYLLRCPSVFDVLDPRTNKINKNTPDKAILFARAILEFLRAYDDFRVDLIHCNDWHTGLVPVYLKTHYTDDPYLGRVATLYTTHNAAGDAFQGGFPEDGWLLPLAGLSPEQVFQGGKTQSLFHNNRFNFSKGGFGFADLLNTVSRRYREELLMPAFAAGLEGVFKDRAGDFTGVVNGIDTSEWDPATDKHLKRFTFSKDNPVEATRNKKRQVRQLLRNWIVSDEKHPRKGQTPFSTVEDGSILVGVVTRIDFQKVSILFHAIDRICSAEDVQVVLLGNADRNDSRGMNYEAALRQKAQDDPRKLAFFDGFDIPLSHLIYAASEIFLVPSVFEPCGLTQLAAMRYGSVPVVRSTGGLMDTVIDEADSARAGSATGFQFKEDLNEFTLVDEQRGADRLVSRFQDALNLYKTNPTRWNALMLNCMSRDSSWSVPSMQYMKLYHEAVRRNLQRTFFASESDEAARNVPGGIASRLA